MRANTTNLRPRAIGAGRRAVGIALGGAALALLAACGGGGADADAGVDVEVSFDPAPRVGATVLQVRLSDAAGAPVEGATVSVEGNMNHAGMVPVFAEPTESEPGVYSAPFEFTMGGDWFVVVDAELADGGSVQETVDVPAVPATAADDSGS